MPAGVLFVYKSLVLFVSFKSIRRGNFKKYLFLGVWFPGKSLKYFYKIWKNWSVSSGKSYLFLYDIYFSQYIRFGQRPPGKFCVFWRNFDKKLSWKNGCVLEILKKMLLEKKNRYFIKKARRLLLFCKALEKKRTRFFWFFIFFLTSILDFNWIFLIFLLIFFNKVYVIFFSALPPDLIPSIPGRGDLSFLAFFYDSTI